MGETVELFMKIWLYLKKRPWKLSKKKLKLLMRRKKLKLLMKTKKLKK
jgi:hypothetical protein